MGTIILSIFIHFTISSAFIELIDGKTKYDPNGDDKYPDSHIFLIILFGPFCFLFLNKLRKWRKIGYYKYRLKYLKRHEDFPYLIYDNVDNYYAEIKRIKRKLSLEKINKKK